MRIAVACFFLVLRKQDSNEIEAQVLLTRAAQVQMQSTDKQKAVISKKQSMEARYD